MNRFLLASLVGAVASSEVRDLYAENKVVFMGSMNAAKGKVNTATVLQGIKGCLPVKSKNVNVVLPDCDLPTDVEYLFVGTSSGKKKKLKVALTCDAIPLADVSAEDRLWLNRQVDVCTKKKSICPSKEAPLPCLNDVVCSKEAIAGCQGATKCEVNSCGDCTPIFSNKKGKRLCMDSETSFPDACGDKAAQLPDCPGVALKKATTCVTDEVSGKAVWTNDFGAEVCASASQHTACLDRTTVDWNVAPKQTGKGKGKGNAAPESKKLGVAVVDGTCQGVVGTNNPGISLFDSLVSCEMSCPAPVFSHDNDFRRPCLPGSNECCPDDKAPYNCDLTAVQVVCANLDCEDGEPNYCIPDGCNACDVDVYDSQDKKLTCEFVPPPIQCPGQEEGENPLEQCGDRTPACGPRPDQCPIGLKLTCITDCDCADIWVSEDNRHPPEKCAAQLVDLIVQTRKPCKATDEPEMCCQPGNFKKEDCSGTNSEWTCNNMNCDGQGEISKCDANPCDECNVHAFDKFGAEIDITKCTLGSTEVEVCPFEEVIIEADGNPTLTGGPPDCSGAVADCGPWPATCSDDWVLDCVIDPCTCLPGWRDNDIRFATLSCQLASTPECVGARGESCPLLKCNPMPDDAEIPAWLVEVGFKCVQHPCTCVPFWQPNVAVGIGQGQAAGGQGRVGGGPGR